MMNNTITVTAFGLPGGHRYDVRTASRSALNVDRATAFKVIVGTGFLNHDQTHHFLTAAERNPGGQFGFTPLVDCPHGPRGTKVI